MSRFLSACFDSSPNSAYDVVNNTPSYGRGAKNMVLLFVDTHSQSVPYRTLNPTFQTAGQYVYNRDWTAGEVRGADSKQPALSVAAHGSISFRKGHHLHQMAAGVGGIKRLPDSQIAGLARGEQAGITCAGG